MSGGVVLAAVVVRHLRSFRSVQVFQIVIDFLVLTEKPDCLIVLRLQSCKSSHGIFSFKLLSLIKSAL